MTQSLVEVLRLWEDTTGVRLSPAHRAAFRERAEAGALAALPRRALERAAVAVHFEAGELRLSTWLEAAGDLRRDEPMLRIELVPSTCWWSNLRSELPAEEWAVCKRLSARQAGHRCEVCGGRGPRWPVECHELWSYVEAEGPRTQRLDGLISLCPACHEATHMGFANVRGRLEEAMDHLLVVNGWDRRRGDFYLDACERTWLERSRHDWSLDVSWLTAILGIAVEVTRRPAET